MGTEQTRTEKMAWIESYFEIWFKKHKKTSINVKTLSAIFCMHFNTSHKTFKEMLEILERTGSILIEDGEIFRK